MAEAEHQRGISWFHMQRLAGAGVIQSVQSVGSLLAQASKSKPALKRAKPLTEWEVQQQIKADLTPHLDQMREDDYSYFIHYYETYHQSELADWLRIEQAKRHPQKKASSEGRSKKPDQEVA